MDPFGNGLKLREIEGKRASITKCNETRKK